MLIGIIFYGGAHKSWILLSYEINKLEIIEKFCINKEETAFKCDGMCHLKTELNKADSQDQSPITNNSETNQITWFGIAFKKIECKKQSITKNKFCLAPIIEDQKYSSSIFHPPKV